MLDRHDRFVVALAAGSIFLLGCAEPRPDETDERRLARLTISDDELEDELAAERELDARDRVAAVAEAELRRADELLRRQEHDRRVVEARGVEDPEVEAALAAMERSSAGVRLRWEREHAPAPATSAATSGSVPTAAARPAGRRDDQALIAEWQPRFGVLQDEARGLRRDIDFWTDRKEELRDEFPRAWSHGERRAIEIHSVRLNIKIEDGERRLADLQRQFGELREQARRARVPAIVHRGGL